METALQEDIARVSSNKDPHPADISAAAAERIAQLEAENSRLQSIVDSMPRANAMGGLYGNHTAKVLSCVAKRKLPPARVLSEMSDFDLRHDTQVLDVLAETAISMDYAEVSVDFAEWATRSMTAMTAHDCDDCDDCEDCDL